MTDPSSRDPLANVCRAILERDALRFATLKKVDRAFTNQGHVLQVQYDVAMVFFRADERFQLG